MPKRELRRNRILLRLQKSEDILPELLRCFSDVTDYRVGNADVPIISFETIGNKATREWIYETVYEVTLGVGNIQRITVECLDADPKQSSQEDAGRSAPDRADPSSDS